VNVHILPLVPDAVLPVVAPATTRSTVPHGYGVQEQCLPFTAATALGLLVKSPISFGFCRGTDVPTVAHRFRSPLENARSGGSGDDRLFYVIDDPPTRFVGNAFTFDAIADQNRQAYTPVCPGVSFFDREDQLDLFKLHLPYLCRTDDGVDALYLSPINRLPPFAVLSGLVETDWYANPVNLILRKPPASTSVHVSKGDPIAQIVFIHRSHRRPTVNVLSDHARMTRDLRQMMGEWFRRHNLDRSAYKQLVRSQHGRIESRPPNARGVGEE
jgi:uncharacterized protein DUF6065